MTQKKVAIYSLHAEDPCATIRLLSPLSAVGLDIYKPDPDMQIDEAELAKCSFIVIQRSYPKQFTQYIRIMEIARSNRIPVIFEVDDFLFNLPLDHIERVNNIYTESLLPMLQALIEADQITVPTKVLRNKLSPFNPNITIIPNYMDDRLWDLREPAHTESNMRLVIGYMGTETHKPDLEMLLPVFAQLEKKYLGQLTFRFWGISEISEMESYESVEYVPPINDSYARFARTFQTQYADIFVAPLRDNTFNRCKSPVKFFEYTALGVPGVYSNYEPYQEVISQGAQGFLASSLDEWLQHLEKLINNPILRRDIALSAQKNLRENWMLSSHTEELQKVFYQFAELDKQYEDVKRNRYELVNSINSQYQTLVTNHQTLTDNYQSINKKHQTLTENFLNLVKCKEEVENDLSEKKRQVSERDGWILEKEKDIIVKNDMIQELNHEIDNKSEEIQSLILEVKDKNESIQSLSFELNEIHISKVWKVALLMRQARLFLAPPNSRRFLFAKKIFHFLQGEKIRQDIKSQEKLLTKELDLWPITQGCDNVSKHTQSVDIIICVHNAQEDIQRCLESVAEHSTEPYRLILVDDGSDTPTKKFLEDWSDGRKNIRLIRNEEAKGYTLAANIGMRSVTADFLVLLNSDTIVSPSWLDRLCKAMDENPKIGVVGPLSNTASWQSIPELSVNGDWATNPLPQGVTVEKMADQVSKYSACIHPEVPLLNGFCMMIRRKALDDVGLFDEVNFGQGYGEEDDFNLRAEGKGWRKVIADDVYIYHAQSKSYSSEKRFQLSRMSGAKLFKKHGSENIARRVAFMNPNRVMEGIRARTKVMLEREEWVEKEHEVYAGKRVLFVLPVIDAGGGANVILDEACSMQKMGVDVQVMNLLEYKHAFLQNYKHSKVPFIFENVENLSKVAQDFDAVVATAHYSVPWFKQIEQSGAILGYYVQGYEALMYPEGSAEAQAAKDTYSMIEGMRLFTKTNWTREQVAKHAGAICDVVGVSVNIDLLRPRDCLPFGAKPVRVGAMIRPASPYRNPEFTARVFGETKKKHGSDLEIYLFGSNNVEEIVSPALLDFEYHQLGKLTQLQVASLMSRLDIFADYSSHQAMGLSALEAMCAGSTVIVPKNGGAIEFVRHKGNGMVVDTTNYVESLNGLEELITDDQLRKQLQLNAIHDVVNYYPEKAAVKILRTLFRN